MFSCRPPMFAQFKVVVGLMSIERWASKGFRDRIDVDCRLIHVELLKGTDNENARRENQRNTAG